MCPLRLILVAVFIEAACCCETGRLFLGSINETYPQHLDKNGIYVVESTDDDGFPIYKHQSHDYYMYHVSGTLLSSSYWVVGEVPGSLSVDLSIQTAAETPETAREKWRIWDAEHTTWSLQRHLKIKCVDQSFGTCPSGRVRLHGLSPWNHHQRNRTGLYTVTGQTYGLRPVYRHGELGDPPSDFLYFVDGLWMVGPEVGRVSAALFSLDYAWRAEYIVDTWIVFNGMQFQKDSRLKVTCAGSKLHPLSGSGAEEEPEINTSDILLVAEGMLGEGGDQLPVCDQSYCQNGGTCLRNEVNALLCACLDGFTGSTCENEISCSDAPMIDNGDLLSQTGHQFHDVAFYACAQDFQRVGDSAAVCGASGQWDGVPTCVHWLDFLSPGVPSASSGPTRRHVGRGHRRGHRRNVREAGQQHQLHLLKSLF